MADQNRDGGTAGTGDREAAAAHDRRQHGGSDGPGAPDAGSPGGMGGVRAAGGTGTERPPGGLGPERADEESDSQQ
jgi:hypothetical protein